MMCHRVKFRLTSPRAWTGSTSVFPLLDWDGTLAGRVHPVALPETEVRMLATGQYVRHRMAPDTLMGTIEGVETQRGRVFYRFRQDPRLREPISASLRNASFLEDELELCDRPSDEYWADVNARIGHSSWRVAA